MTASQTFIAGSLLPEDILVLIFKWNPDECYKYANLAKALEFPVYKSVVPSEDISVKIMRILLAKGKTKQFMCFVDCYSQVRPKQLTLRFIWEYVGACGNCEMIKFCLKHFVIPLTHLNSPEDNIPDVARLFIASMDNEYVCEIIDKYIRTPKLSKILNMIKESRGSTLDPPDWLLDQLNCGNDIKVIGDVMKVCNVNGKLISRMLSIYFTSPQNRTSNPRSVGILKYIINHPMFDPNIAINIFKNRILYDNGYLQTLLKIIIEHPKFNPCRSTYIIKCIVRGDRMKWLKIILNDIRFIRSKKYIQPIISWLQNNRGYSGSEVAIDRINALLPGDDFKQLDEMCDDHNIVVEFDGAPRLYKIREYFENIDKNNKKHHVHKWKLVNGGDKYICPHCKPKKQKATKK